MATATTPRVEIQMKATKTIYLSNDPTFYLILEVSLYNSEDWVVFLQDGFADLSRYQPINSNNVIKCFDNDTGEQVHIIRQSSKPLFLDSNYIQFTTCNTRQSYELPIITSSLQPGRKYRLHFNPTTISHWPASAESALNSLAEALGDSVSQSSFPPPSTQPLPWKAAEGHDTIIFETRAARPNTPKVTVSLSAPETCSSSKPFQFTLTFSTDATFPFTVFSNRTLIKSTHRDIEILEATSRRKLALNMDICYDPEEEQREDFLTIQGTYIEQREVDFQKPLFNEAGFEVGKEYILRHLDDDWWWTEDSVDDIMEYLNSWSSAGMAMGEHIKFAGAGEVRFKFVE